MSEFTYLSGDCKLVHGEWPFGKPEKISVVEGTVKEFKSDNRDPEALGKMFLDRYAKHKKHFMKTMGEEPILFSKFIDIEYI